MELRVRLFSQVDVSLETCPLPRFPTQKSAALFAFLVLQRGRPHRREALIGRFWSEHPEAEARKALRNELWRVRSVIEPHGVPPGTFLRAEGARVAFNVSSSYWLDIEEFERRLAPFTAGRVEGPVPSSYEDVKTALDLYRGDLLEGVDEEWCLYERQRLSTLYVHATQRLIDQLIDRGEWGRAVGEAQRLLAYDPLIEHVHRHAMRGYAELDNRGAFVRQYHLCAEVLGRELGVEPSDETISLFEHIQREHHWIAGAAAAGVTAPLAGALHRGELEVARALAGLQEAKRRSTDATALLQQAIEVVVPLVVSPPLPVVAVVVPLPIPRRR